MQHSYVIFKITIINYLQKIDIYIVYIAYIAYISYFKLAKKGTMLKGILRLFCCKDAEQMPILREEQVERYLYLRQIEKDTHEERMAEMRERIDAYRRANALILSIAELRRDRAISQFHRDAVSKKLENDIRMIRLEHERQRQHNLSKR